MSKRPQWANVHNFYLMRLFHKTGSTKSNNFFFLTRKEEEEEDQLRFSIPAGKGNLHGNWIA